MLALWWKMLKTKSSEKNTSQPSPPVLPENVLDGIGATVELE